MFIPSRRGRGRGKAQAGRGKKGKRKSSSPEPEASSSDSGDAMEVDAGGSSAPTEAPVLRPRRRAASLGEEALEGGGIRGESADDESEWEDT